MHTIWPLLAASLAAVAWLGTGVLAEGGLAVLVVAGVGAALGVPVANALSRAVSPTTRDLAQAGSTLLGAVAVATPLSGLAGEAVPSWVCVGAAVALWWLARPSAAIGPVFAAVVVAAIGWVTVSSGRWTLVDPAWSDAGAWWPAALAGGVLLAAPLAGGWSVVTERAHAVVRPQLPWAIAGMALLVAVGTALLTSFSLARPESLALMVLAAGCAVPFGVVRPGSGRANAMVGALLTILLIGPGQPALALLWSVGLPVVIGAVAALLARSATGWQRGALAATAVAMFAVAALGWPGMPATVGAASTLALLPVLAVWTVGTNAVRRSAA